MSLLSGTIPIFVIIFLGWIAASTSYLGERVERGLSDYVFAIAIPALIFSALIRSDVSGSVHASYWAAYFGGCAVVWAISWYVASRFLQQHRREALLSGFATSQSNTVFVGVPLILHVYGDAGTLPLFMLLAVHLPVMLGAATFLIESDNPKPMHEKLGGLALTLLRNPIFLSLVAGGMVRFFHPTLPSAVTGIIHSFGSTASTCALFSLGMALHRLGNRGRWKNTALISFGKLVLHPLIVWFLAFHVFSMPAAFAGVATLFAAMPVGINAYLLAARYQAGEGAIASSVAVTTLFSIVSITIWLAILGHGS